MGLLEGFEPKGSIEDSFEEELNELKSQKAQILSQIGEKFVEENKDRDMARTEYEDLFLQLSEVEREIELAKEPVIDGEPLGEFQDGEEEIPMDKSAFNRTKLMMTCMLLLVVAFFGLAVFLLSQKPKITYDTVPASLEAEVTESGENTAITQTANEDELLAQFGLFKSNVADYSNAQVLDHSKYKKYNSGIGKFSFCYPSDIYNNVAVVSEQGSGAYGKTLQQIALSGSDESTAVFTVYENGIALQGNNLESMTKYVLNSEKDALFTPMVKVNEISQEGGYGTVIMTAYTDGGSNSGCVYDLLRVETDNIYQMKLTYPRPKDEEEDKQKAYYVNAMYRLCGFSGSKVTTPDSYESFVKQNYTNFKLESWQKDIFWNIFDNMVTSRELYAEYGKESVVPVGNMDELEAKLSEDPLLLQMYLTAGLGKDVENIQSERYACVVDYGENGSKMFYKDEVGKESFEEYYSKASGEKDVLHGALDYAKTFYRDLFDMELDVDSVIQDNKGVIPGNSSILLYNKDMDELVYASGYKGKSRVDGPDDWDYNEELDCFDYHLGPVYELFSSNETWQQKRDAIDPGNGIYVVHLRPYKNNTLGFKILGIERAE